MFKRRKHRVPELNTTSTADISFMLLIFFLVASSMDTDKGLTRQLPPPDRHPRPEETNVSKDDLLSLKIAADNQLTADGMLLPMNRVQARVTQLLNRRGRHHLIAIEVDLGADYNTYFLLQNHLAAAYRDWRNRTARQQFGCSFDRCTPPQKDAVRARCPQRVMEAQAAHAEGGGR